MVGDLGKGRQVGDLHLGNQTGHVQEAGIYHVSICARICGIYIFVAHEKPSYSEGLLWALVPTWELGQMTGRCCPPWMCLGLSAFWYHNYIQKKLGELICSLGIGSIILYLSYCINDKIY